jgi:myosin heavy chain 6/7
VQIKHYYSIFKGIVDAHLVMHQLHCNGVLEGIRICRKGFPNRMIYAEFKQRYSILAPNAIPKGFVDATKATADIIKEIKLNEDTFRLGTTKVFFRAGMLGQLEELRDAAVSKIIAMLQAQIRVFKMKKVFKRMLEQKLALSVVQRNIKKYLAFRNWGWWKLMTKIKPLLTNVKAEEELKAKEEEFKRIQAEAEAREKQRKELEENQAKILQEKNDMKLALEAEKEALAQVESKAQGLTLQKAELEAQLKDLQSRLGEEEGAASQLEAKKKKLETEMGDLKNTIQDKQTAILKAEAENKQKDNQIHQLQNEMAQQDESIAKLNKEKKRLEEVNQHTLEQLQKEEDKVNHLNKAQAKLTQTLDEVSKKII